MGGYIKSLSADIFCGVIWYSIDMDPMVQIGERVDVVVVYRKDGDAMTLAYPAKMNFHGQEVVFTRMGMRHPTAQGKRMIHVFDMTDGTNDYRLEFDAERLTWTLVSMLPGSQYE